MWTMPFANALRKKHPQAAILIVCNERVMYVWQGVPYCNMCVKDEFWNMQGLVRGADEVFDFAGVATGKEKRLDPVESIFRIGELPLPKESRDCRPHLIVTIDEGKRAEALLRREGIEPKTDKIITIALESSTSNRNWVFEYVKELTRTLIADDFKVIWLGESTDYETRMLDDVTNSIGATNLVHRTNLREAMAIIALTDVFVGPASGLMIIATSLEIPTVGLFGAFNPQSRDKFYTKFVPIWHKIECAPCNEHWTECAKGHPAPCMKVIGPNEVYQAIKKLKTLYPRSLLGKLPIE
jgi:ADP-heptose:LPS heptosyltransferase